MQFFKDLHAAMKMLGLNPMEQEIIDLTNNIVRNGFIYFPEFCEVILKKFREEDEDAFNQNMFKVNKKFEYAIETKLATGVDLMIPSIFNFEDKTKLYMVCFLCLWTTQQFLFGDVTKIKKLSPIN